MDIMECGQNLYMPVNCFAKKLSPRSSVWMLTKADVIFCYV